MINLVEFELKKIFSKKVLWIILIVLMFFNVMLYKSTSLPSISVLPNENSDFIYGVEAVKFDKSVTKKYEGILTDEKVQQMLKDFAPSKSFLQRVGGINVASIHMNSMQQAVQSKFANPDGTWNGLKVADVYGDAKIQVGYNTGWLYTCDNMIKSIIAIGFLILVVVSPIFSGEYSGMDALILTSRYGKNKCVSAKLIAAFLSTFFITVFFMLFNVIVAVISFGTDGLNASISFSCCNCFENLPYDMTCKTLLIYEIILAFTSTFGITAITLILSSVCKNSFITLVLAVIAHVFPLMIPVSEYSPLYKYLILFPIYQGQVTSILSIGKIPVMGNEAFYTVVVIPFVIVLCIIGCSISKIFFSKHQVA